MAVYKRNGEQAIFVNGKLDAISFDRPAYLGSDSLYVGFVNFTSPRTSWVCWITLYLVSCVER